MLVEETTVPPTHVMVTLHPAFAYPYGTEILQGLAETALIDPVGNGPMFL